MKIFSVEHKTILCDIDIDVLFSFKGEKEVYRRLNRFYYSYADYRNEEIFAITNDLARKEITIIPKSKYNETENKR